MMHAAVADEPRTTPPHPAWTAGPDGRVVDGSATPSDRNFALFTHLSGLLVFLDFFTGVAATLAALVLWLLGRDRSPFAEDHTREALNFQLSTWIWTLIGVVLFIPTLSISLWLVLLVIVILRLVGALMGAVAANRGELYRYPMTFRLLR